MTAGACRLTAVSSKGVADKPGIPAACPRRMRKHDLLPLYNANLNARLGRDDSTFLICYLPGVARALLDRCYIIGHLDMLMAVPDGMRTSGYPVQACSCDLTGHRLYVRVRCGARRCGVRPDMTDPDPGLSLDTSHQNLRWQHTRLIRALESLPVRWQAAAPWYIPPGAEYPAPQGRKPAR